MIYADLDGQRIKATIRQRAHCPFCGNEVTAVIGQFVTNHWRHLKTTKCDSWSEPETEWHREWKGHFPEHYREVIMYDEVTGEKHIADIRTDSGVTIEFQNSPIPIQELISRNKFYKKIIWVVNGNAKHCDNLNAQINLIVNYGSYEAKFLFYGRSKIFDKWMSSSTPVFFDFGEQHLYLLKQYSLKNGIFKLMRKEIFLETYKM